jgi:hypothetical protein
MIDLRPKALSYCCGFPKGLEKLKPKIIVIVLTLVECDPALALCQVRYLIKSFSKSYTFDLN